MTSISRCRICGSPELAEVIDLGTMALTGIFPKPGVEVPGAPLRLLRCTHGCGLVQLADTYDLSKMYGASYGYRSGLNKSMVAHLQGLVGQILERRSVAGLDIKAGDVVVDIGANDGTTLGFFPESMRRIGVDPSGAKFKQFYKPGIELIPDFFSAARVIPALQGRRADIVTSIAMFYDLEDPQAFVKEVEGILADDGIWVMEQSYLPAMMRANAFDTICHEHIEYYALAQIEWLASQAGLEVIDVAETDTNGGSFVVTLAKRGVFSVSSAVHAMLAAETMDGLGTQAVYDAFRLRSLAAIAVLEDFLRVIRASGETCSCLGASTKGNVVLQSLLGAQDLIQSVGDVNPDKWGCVTPGTLIPILSEHEVLASEPDYLVVLPWHFKTNFLSNPRFLGHRLVFPLPQLEIVQL